MAVPRMLLPLQPTKTITKKQKWQINTASTYLSKRQVRELLTRVSKNLTTAKPRQEAAQREGTTPIAGIKGKIVEFLWHLKKEAYSPKAIEVYSKRLQQLAENCDISNPEKVKEFIANRETWNNSTKLLTVSAYKTFADFADIPFKPPRYKPQEKNSLHPNRKRTRRPNRRLRQEKIYTSPTAQRNGHAHRRSKKT